MMHPQDQSTSMPKAFIFRKGQATLWATPVNDNRSGDTPWWRHSWIWALLGGGAAFLLLAL